MSIFEILIEIIIILPALFGAWGYKHIYGRSKDSRIEQILSDFWYATTFKFFFYLTLPIMALTIIRYSSSYLLLVFLVGYLMILGNLYYIGFTNIRKGKICWDSTSWILDLFLFILLAPVLFFLALLIFFNNHDTEYSTQKQNHFYSLIAAMVMLFAIFLMPMLIYFGIVKGIKEYYGKMQIVVKLSPETVRESVKRNLLINEFQVVTTIKDSIDDYGQDLNLKYLQSFCIDDKYFIDFYKMKIRTKSGKERDDTVIVSQIIDKNDLDFLSIKNNIEIEINKLIKDYLLKKAYLKS